MTCKRRARASLDKVWWPGDNLSCDTNGVQVGFHPIKFGMACSE